MQKRLTPALLSKICIIFLCTFSKKSSKRVTFCQQSEFSYSLRSKLPLGPPMAVECQKRTYRGFKSLLHEVANVYRPLHLCRTKSHGDLVLILSHGLIERLDCTYHGFYSCPVKFCPVVFIMRTFIEVSPFT